MSDVQRPGGLTALAVVNFVLGGLGAVSFLALVAFALIAPHLPKGDPGLAQAQEQLQGGRAWFMAFDSAIEAFLLIASGIGYLGMKRRLGRYYGNAYALIALAFAVSFMFAGFPFGLGTIAGMIYPAITLALLNTTFREDLVH